MVGAGLKQWWEHLLSTKMVWVRSPTRYYVWIEFLFFYPVPRGFCPSSLLFPASQKRTYIDLP